MEGLDPREPENDQQQYKTHIGRKRNRWIFKYYLTIPTAWTQAGAHLNLPEASSPDSHHVGSRNVFASLEWIYLSSEGLMELGDQLHVALASRSMAAQPPPSAGADSAFPLSLLELLIDLDWLLVDHTVPKHRIDLPVATALELSLRGILGLIEALQWELDRRRGLLQDG